jgi:hypothetical protein
MTNLTKSNSTESGKAASLDKLSAKASTWPFKKIKKSAAAFESTPPIYSCSSTTASDNDHSNQPSTDSQSDSEPKVETVKLTPQEALGMSFNSHLETYTNYICVRGTPEALVLAHLQLFQIRCRFPVL